MLLCLLALLGLSSALPAQTFPTTGPSQKVVNLVCIGDSITQAKNLPNRDQSSPPAVLARELAAALPAGTTVYLSNVGVSGRTTLDWLPTTKLFATATKAAHTLTDAHPTGQLVFSVMLGTNDSANKGPHGAPVAAEQYGQNLKAIADALAHEFPDCRIVLHHPIWYSTNTHNTSDYEGASAHDRLRSYFPTIDALVAADAKSAPPHLYAGDADAYDYFAHHADTDFIPEKGQNGTFYLHPNVQGAAALGKFWATAVAKGVE